MRLQYLENREATGNAVSTHGVLPTGIPPSVPPRVVSTNLSPFHLPPQVLKSSLIGCRCRKNLAGRLAEKNLF